MADNTEKNNEPMIMAPRDEPEENIVQKIAATTEWGKYQEEKQQAAASAAQDAMQEQMVKIINYMNKINGAGKMIDAEAITSQLIEKFSDKALDLLKLAVNEPSNFALYTGDNNIKTSRAAVNALSGLSEENADKILAHKDYDLKSVLKTQAEVHKTIKETQKTIDRIKNAKPSFSQDKSSKGFGFNVTNPLDNAIQNNLQQANKNGMFKNKISLGVNKHDDYLNANQQKLEKALAKPSSTQISIENSEQYLKDEIRKFHQDEVVKNDAISDRPTDKAHMILQLRGVEKATASKPTIKREFKEFTPDLMVLRDRD